VDELRTAAVWRLSVRRAVRVVTRAAGRCVRALVLLEVAVAPSSAERARGWHLRLLRDARRDGRMRDLPDAAVARGLAEADLPPGTELEGLVNQAVERLCRANGPGLPNRDGDDPCMHSSEVFGE